MLSSFVGPVCMGEGQPWLLEVGPLAVVPPPLGPFVTGASMLLIIWSGERQRLKNGDGNRGTIDIKEREREFTIRSFSTIFNNSVQLICSTA